MVSVAYILIIAVFITLIAVGIVLFTIFWFKMIIQLKQKIDMPPTIKNIDLDKSIYERMADDTEATGQYGYMRLRLFG